MGIVGCGLNYHQLLQGLTVASCSTVYDAFQTHYQNTSLGVLHVQCSITPHLGVLSFFCDFHVSLLCVFGCFVSVYYGYLSLCVCFVYFHIHLVSQKATMTGSLETTR